jgi:hypothetical protein
LSRKTKEIIKEIATFGENQFHETGAAAVEVLRVKASTIRKLFRKLRGIAYLVSVISLDRVRIYFFNTAGILLLAENIELNMYSKIRKTSRLIIKYEKPRPPTEEELRIEATEELRTELSKAIRRVSRMLGQKEPMFPKLFVSRENLNHKTQSFGLFLLEDGTMIFEEKSIESNFAEGLNIRAAMLLLLDLEQAQHPFSQCLGNSLAYSLLKEPSKEVWLKAWIANTPDELLRRTLIHFVRHTSTYTEQGYHRIIALLQETPPISQLEQWIDGLELIHDTLDVPLGTEEYQIIKQFCSILETPLKFTNSPYILDSIHLNPRTICDPAPLGVTLFILEEDSLSESNEWLSIQYLEGSERKCITLSENGTNPVSSIDYILNIEDLFPKPAGIVAHGKDFVRWAKQRMGLLTDTKHTFEKRIEFSNTSLTSGEEAVLERLVEGKLDIILNSLVGSPKRVISLLKKGKVIFLPDFQHLGIHPDFLLVGDYDPLYTCVKEYSLESTILNSTESAYAIVCAPIHWKSMMMKCAANEKFRVFPIVQINSPRHLIRCEEILPSNAELESWMTSHQ